MAQTPHGQNLLDHLARLAGCQYLSDLHFPITRTGLRYALLNTPVSEFPEAQWKDAVHYILGENRPGGAAEQRQALLDYAVASLDNPG